MIIDDSFYAQSRTIHVRLAQYQIQILRLVGPCMSVAWWRHFRVQFFFDVHTFSSPFQRRPDGTEFPFTARMILSLLCRAVRKQIASRREQYTIGGGEPRTRDEILWGGQSYCTSKTEFIQPFGRIYFW